MRTSLLGTVACALLALCAAAHAEDFPTYLTGKGTITLPLTSSDRVPVTRGGRTFQLPGSQVLTPTGAATVTGKTIDCNQNTCLNFPGGVLPTSCVDLADGSAYNNGGIPAICNSTASYLALNGGGHIALNSGGALLIN